MQILFFENRANNYEKVLDLDEVNFKVFSQNGEDGIINYMLHQMNIKKPKFVEIGVGDFSECNTRFIYKKNYPEGLIIDVIKDFKKKVSKIEDIWKGGLNIIEGQVNNENINQILEKNKFNIDVDLFSIDIDGIDYWVLKSLPTDFSKLAIAEYNPYFGDKFLITVPIIKISIEQNIIIQTYVLVAHFLLWFS